PKINGFANVHAEGNSIIRTTTPDVNFGTLSYQSTVILDGGGNRFQPAVFGSLTIRGTNYKSPTNGATIVVRNVLKIEPNAGLQNSGQNNAEFVVLGTFDMQSTTLPAVNRAFPIRFGGTNPVLNLSVPRVRFESITVLNDVTLSVLPMGTRVVEIDSDDEKGHLTIEDRGKLKLNGNQLDLRNIVAINPNNETGTIDLGGSSFTLDSDDDGIFNLYPERGNDTFTSI